jgi:hypothetical protein
MRSCRSFAGRRGWPMWALAMMLGLAGGAVPLTQTAVDSVQIVPQIGEAAPSTAARGVFYQQTLAATLPGSSVLLASSPDGQGWLCTDDQATLTFATGGHEALTWSHRFAGADRRAITCLPPQRLDLPMAAYQITVTLEDLYPNTSSSRPYYLVFAAGAAPAGATALPAPPPATRAVAQRSPPTTIEVAPATSAHVVAVATLGPAATVATTPDSPGTQPATPPTLDLRLVAWLIGVALLLGLAVLIVRRRNRRRTAEQPPITGILYLFDQETREARTEIVRGGAQLDVRRRPLRVATVAAAEASQGIAQIRPSSDGLLLYESAADAAVPLVHDRLYALAGGVVTLRYREPGGGRRSTANGRRPTIDDRRSTMEDHRVHRILPHIIAFVALRRVHRVS